MHTYSQKEGHISGKHNMFSVTTLFITRIGLQPIGLLQGEVPQPLSTTDITTTPTFRPTCGMVYRRGTAPSYGLQ